MAEAVIPVDLFNPGQVFACLGFVEASDVLLGGAAGNFSWQSRDANFTLSADTEENPVASVLKFLESAKISAIRPAGSDLENKQGITTSDFFPRRAFPTIPPEKKARLIARLENQSIGKIINLTYWGEVPGQCKIKLWGGNRTATGIASNALKFCKHVDIHHPFQHEARSGGVFRFDPAGSYLPIDSGFSINEHKNEISIVGFPVTEILAAIGMTYARPIISQHKVSYRFRVYGETPPLCPVMLRAMLSSFSDMLPCYEERRFEFKVKSPSSSSEEYPITEIQELPQETNT